MSELAPVLRQRFFDANGLPLAGGLIYTYAAGTTIPKLTYTDYSLSTPNSNPIVLDANGYAAIWFDTGAYKFVVSDSNDVVQFTTDNVQTISDLIATLINTQGALAATNNLSDLTNKATALQNLGIAPFTYQNVYSITANQSASDLTNESFDGASVSSVDFMIEVTQGTTVNSKIFFSLVYVNSVWEKLDGESRERSGNPTGVRFSLGTQAGSVVKLQASESGVGNGTAKVSKKYFYV